MKLSSIVMLSMLLVGSSFASCFSEKEIKRELKSIAAQSYKAGQTNYALNKKGVKLSFGAVSNVEVTSSNENCMEAQTIQARVAVTILRKGPGGYMSRCGGSVLVEKMMNKNEGVDSYSVSNKKMLRCTR